MSDKRAIETALALKLKPREEDRLLSGHAWVFSNELQAVPRDAAPGTLATIENSQGRPLGVGFFNPKSLISFRLLSRNPVAIDASFFRGKLEAALEYRKKRLPDADSFRLCFGESDGLPGLVVDKYAEFLVLQVLAAGIETRLSPIQEALVGLLAPKGIYLKNNHPARVLEGLPTEDRTLFGSVPARIKVLENGLKLTIAPCGGQAAGLPFDQRDNRAALAPYLKGRVVLDLSCGVGVASLEAARGGARKVLGADSSELAVTLAGENALANGLAEVCDFDHADTEEVLAAFARERQALRPDLILLQSPGVIASKKRLSGALRAHGRANSEALRALSKGGLLATSTASHHISREAFVDMLRGAAAKAARQVRIIELRGAASDHPALLSMPETEYLQYALLEVV